jgi:protocatechuate 3,4-dioxygenase alpha subunit
MYFAGDEGLDSDPILSLVPAERRATMIASPAPGEPDVWSFDIRLQGERETVGADAL